MLEDFQTGTASMARKRHLASNARGFCGFCLTFSKGFKRFKKFKSSRVLIRPIRIIRGINENYIV